MRRTIYHSDKEGLVELFVGKSVAKVGPDLLQLSDGTVLEIVPNLGCGGCSMGNYWIESLNECENIITNVELVESNRIGDTLWSLGDDIYDLFVYSGHTAINLLSVAGRDNGYYGSGFWIQVRGSK